MGPGQRRTRSAGIISGTGVQQWTEPVNTPLLYLTPTPHIFKTNFHFNPFIFRQYRNNYLQKGYVYFDIKKSDKKKKYVLGEREKLPVNGLYRRQHITIKVQKE